MKKITKKILSIFMSFAIILSNFLPFMPMMTVHATSIVNEIRLTSSTTSVEPGELPAYSAATTTEHVSSIDEYGSNTNWVKWAENASAWSGFGVQTPTAVNDGKTHYGLNISVNLEDGYAFDENTKIYFNGTDVTSLGYTELKAFSWGGYVIVDLGTAGEELPKYTISYDANGGTGTMASRVVYAGTEIDLGMNTFTPPTGMSFNAWKIGDTEYDAGTHYTPTGDTVVKATWTDKYIRESRATMTAVTSSIAPNDLVFTSSEPSKYSVSLWRVFDLTDTSLNTDVNKYPNNLNFVAGHQYAIEFKFEAVSPYEYDETTDGRTSAFYLNNSLTDMSAAVAISGSVYRRVELTANAGQANETHTVTFNLNGGSMTAPSSVEVNHGDTVASPDPAPTKDNATFGGWYEDSEFTIPFDFSIPIISDDVQIYAKWNTFVQTNAIHTIFFGVGGTYRAQYNTTSPAELAKQNVAKSSSGFFSVPDGNEMTLTAIPAEGYTFDGWYSVHEENGSEWVQDDLLSENAVYTFVPTAATPYLMPVFTQNNQQQNYTVTFKDGNNILESRSILGGTTVTRPNPNPTKGGHEFDDWYEDSEFTIPFDFSKPITADTYIYAHFTELAPQPCTLTYDVNGGNPLEPVTRNAGEKINLPTPVKSGATFVEWQVWDEYNNPVGAFLAGEEYEFFENMTLHASWNQDVIDEDIDFNITFENTTGEVLINSKRVMDEGASYVGTKENAGTTNSSQKNTITITTSFGETKASGVTINGTDYNFDDNQDEHVIEVDGAASYTIVVHGDTSIQVDRTIIWANVDANKNSDKYDEDMLLEHGTAKIVAIYNENNQQIGGEVEADENGMAWVPVVPGSKVVFEFVPEYGYQLTSVKANGLDLEPQETINQYTYTMPDTNVHFQAIFKQTSDVVDAGSSKVKSGTISLGEELDGGSAKLTVNDIELSSDKIKDFEKAAGNYKISNYLDIDLYNIFYKGKDDDEDVWENKISELNKEATISIKLEDGIDANDIVLVHNINDGEEYEIIKIESYNKDTNTITFKTKSFSNYAIASKNTVGNNPQTYDAIAMWITVFIVSLAGLAVITTKLKKAIN